MTELELRQNLVNTFAAYLGAKRGSAKHKALVDTYNSYTPLPQGYKLKYTDAWCAGSASAAAILCGLTDIIPVECSCSRQIALWKKLSRWIEDESITPKIGMYCYYDWDDGASYAKNDNMGAPDHVGIVASVNGKTFTVIEGNKGSESVVGYRTMQVNGRYLRGFGDPDFASKATAAAVKPATAVNATVKVSTTGVKAPILKKGVEHPAVKVLQAFLNASGFNCGDVDGDFGAKTDTAFRAFQKSAGLTADGSCGAKSWGAILGT